MGMQMGSGNEDDVIADINTTPLIDVMLVLLIITIPVQLHTVDMSMPVNKTAPPSKPPEVVKIDLDDNGNIFFNGVASTRQNLDAQLQQISLMPDQPEVHLKPTKVTEYRYVASVMAEAQRLGISKIGIVGNERFIR